MIDCATFHKVLKQAGVSFFAGVPDSLLKDICAFITDHSQPSEHVITANEGAAVALATGYHLATGAVPMIYLQNSGLGNLVNPLTSLTDPEVYAIPMLILIGWRGEPGVPDEPQHRKQGRITPAMLESLEIPYRVLPDNDVDLEATLLEAKAEAIDLKGPFALLVRKGTFAPYKLQKTISDSFTLRREDAIKQLLGTLEADAVVVSTTGMTSREVFEHRDATAAGHNRDFLTVGCMGHASQIAMGIALQKSARPVYCLDGDGALLMHLGSLAIIGSSGLKNYKHIVINNGAHDSVGGQPTVGFSVDIPAIAKACGYDWAESVSDKDAIEDALQTLREKENGPALLEIRVNKGARKDLGRPTTTPIENKLEFMRFLESEQ